MMKSILLPLVCFFCPIVLSAQHVPVQALADSSDSRTLSAVMVKAYEQNRKLAEVAAPVSITGPSQLNRFGNASILPALNMTPGVRMEERSPASYRLNIRGSSLRSPFGVRDVKIYYNEIPFTDPGGNTYLNQLSFYNFHSVEIIKGPAGSLYGAGIGGAMLIHTLPSPWSRGVGIDFSAGSYGFNSTHMDFRLGDENHQNYINYVHESSEGYRVQTAEHNDIISWETLLKSDQRQTLHAYMFYGDLYYQTPGGLTLAQYNQNPQQARPAAGTQPSAVQAEAAIFQKNFTAGISNEYQLGDHWSNTTSVYGAYTNFNNPGIRVYEQRKEPHFGGRSLFEYKNQWGGTGLQFVGGAEAQKGFFNTKDYSNHQGAIDSLETDDNIGLWQYMIFAQADLRLDSKWILTAGASFNKSSLGFTRVSIPLSSTYVQNFENKICPRLAILRLISPGVSVYASAARGFSTPTEAELLKSNALNDTLQPEDGMDYEIGARGSFLQERLYFDVGAYFFHIHNAIVQRIDSFGVMYSVNAGATRQNGVEAYVSYQISDQPAQFIRSSKVWLSTSWQDFHYIDFKQLTTQTPATLVEYSGHQLPGIAPYTAVAGLDLSSRPGIYLHLTYTYTDPMFLNDANTGRAGSYNLLGGRIGWKTELAKKWHIDLFAGADNLFSAKYSLGDDINAAVGRYYNAAAGVNYFVGLSLDDLLRP